MSSLLSRMTSFWKAGGTLFGGNRDLYGVFGWKRDPGYSDFLFKYRHQNIAKRIINAPADALWSDPPQLESDDAFNTAWANLLERIPVFATFQRLDKLCRLGRFAILLIGYDDGAALDKPVTNTKGRKILFLQPYGEGSASVSTYDDNPQSSRFGLPLSYEVKTGGLDDSKVPISASLKIGMTFKVHWTRILHVAEGALESTVFGCSALEASYNDLDDLAKVSGGAAETYWLTGNRGLHVDVDKDMELEDEDEEALSEELKEYQHELRRTIRTRGVSVKELGSKVADPRGVFEVLLSLISSTQGIPKRVLTGSEAGQLASQQDRANWAQRVAERVSEFGGPIMLLPFLKQLILSGVLPAPTKLIVRWPDAFKMNPLERAQTSAQMARSATNLANMLKTVSATNIANAEAAKPTMQLAGGGGGLFGNADPKKPATKTPAVAPAPIEIPAILDVAPPIIELLTAEECRTIIGFGKHPPVFDSSDNAVPPAVVDPKA